MIDEGVAPDQVLVTTFTHKAADELHAAGLTLRDEWLDPRHYFSLSLSVGQE